MSGKTEKEKIFLKSWQWLGDNSGLKLTNSIQPLTLLDGFLSEPILLTRDNDGLVNCMSNVCTHRGHILALGADKVKRIRCAYHGRTFDLKGNFKSMPEFDQTKNFPSKNDKFAGWAKRVCELQAEAYKIEYGWDKISIVRLLFFYWRHYSNDYDYLKDYLLFLQLQAR